MQTARKQAPVEDESLPWMSVAAAARELGIGYATVLTRIARRQLEMTEFNGRVFVSRESVEQAKAQG